MLMDSGYIQEKDAEFVNKKRARNNEPPVEPIYTVEDVVNSLDYFHAIGYHRALEILPGVTVTLLDAGHMLGSAIVVLDIEDREAGRDVRLVFSGDLGRHDIPIIRDPETVDHADVLLLESTYGNRRHEPVEDAERRLQEVIHRTYRRGGAVIIPAFAVGRTQQLVYSLHRMTVEGRIRPSRSWTARSRSTRPPCSAAPRSVRRRDRAFMLEAGDPFGFDQLRYTRSVEQSKELNTLRQPFIVISASGMAEAGRILPPAHRIETR